MADVDREDGGCIHGSDPQCCAACDRMRPWTAPLPAGHPEIKAVLDEVLAERLRQEQLLAAGKFSWTCADPRVPDPLKLTVLAEEFGEAAREVCEAIDPAKRAPIETAQRLRKELIQIAAVAVAWAEAIER
jgi:hypothetical protein